MVRSLPVIFFGCAVLAAPFVRAQSIQPDGPNTVVESANRSGDLPALPPLPAGTTTTVGGIIRNLDLVRDQLSLNLYGQHPMKILFDERTQVFRDGVKASLRDLRPEEHASVQTVLDGSDVFAVSIHVLSASPEGECQGRVLNYNSRTSELEISSALSPQPIRLFVPADASVARQGQPSFSSRSSGRNDLVAGALVTATFRPGQDGKGGVASKITILVVPGSSFLFVGKISNLDLSNGLLDLVDPRDGRSYEIHFPSSHIPGSENIRLGQSVSVKAYYDGTWYQAAEITAH